MLVLVLAVCVAFIVIVIARCHQWSASLCLCIIIFFSLYCSLSGCHSYRREDKQHTERCSKTNHANLAPTKRVISVTLKDEYVRVLYQVVVKHT
jgi:hypothetical protein